MTTPPDDEETGWEFLMDGTTTKAELESIIERMIVRVIDDLHATLDADADLTDAERARLFAYAEPCIRQKTRENLLRAHAMLRH